MEAFAALLDHPLALYFNENPLIPGTIISLLIVFILAILARKVEKTQPAEQKKEQEELKAQPRSKPTQETPASVQTRESASQPKETASLKTSSDVEDIKNLDQSSWMKRLKSGLSKTRNSLQSSLGKAFGGKLINEQTLEELHEVLFRADIGVRTTDKLVDHVRDQLKDKEGGWDQVHPLLREKCLEIFNNHSKPEIKPDTGPRVILVVGVNGVGKTTTIGKLAAHFLAEDKHVLLCAADTFRAAAIDQLKVWGERLGVKVVAHQQGSDPAAVAYDGVKAAISRKADVLIIDTAGRLHSKKELMQELNKIKRVIGKDLPEAPHETWLVIDSTTGQNAFAQTRAFNDVVPLSGLVVTKLDGTAKGGVIIGVSDESGLPVRYIGVGEAAKDLRVFKAEDYLSSLFDRD